jgi:hypothetical protein
LDPRPVGSSKFSRTLPKENMGVLATPVSYSHRNLFASHLTPLPAPLNFSLSLPLHKPYVTEYGRVVWAWDSRTFWFG